MTLTIRAIEQTAGVALMLAVAAQCGTPSAPKVNTDPPMYILLAVDGALLPGVLMASGPDTVSVVADSIVLRSDSVAEFRTWVRVTSATRASVTRANGGLLPYSLAGDSITFGVVVYCVTTPCPGPVRGWITPSELRFLRFETVPAKNYRYFRPVIALAP